MPTIECRLDALEAKLMPEPECSTLWVRFVEPGEFDQTVHHIWLGAQEWHRRDGESEEAFRLRAESSAASQRGHTGLLMLMDCKTMESANRSDGP